MTGTLVANTINSGTANTLSLQSSNTTAITVDTSQNVGIGMTSPAVKLNVNGNQINYGTNPYISWSNVYNNTPAYIQYNTSTYEFKILNTGSGSNGFMTFATGGGNEAARIDSSGNVGINSTSPSSFGKFVVAGPSATNVYVGTFVSNTAGDTAYSPLFIVKYDNNTTTSQVFQRFAVNNNGAASGQINANGANAAAFGTWSDERLKENIVNLPSQLNGICALRPVEFDYIESEGGGHQIGFIAQEMQAIYPDAVGERSDGMLTVTGWSKTEARLVAAIKELSAKNDALEAANAAFEARLAAIEEKLK
jgi:hypothetical protein